MVDFVKDIKRNRNTKTGCKSGQDVRLRFLLRRDYGGRAGQVMVEYVIVFVVMLAVIAIFSLCLYAVRQQSNRALDLVASEYP